ncbi:DUF4309 domain-containing protein [Bacillus sp. FJAT-53060]|uniref:DUF4309 domain-containing protein n=1 Tax=Bacillus TaxID=1386 RepID=UPI001CFA3A34|nr:DUF4309 domain-containing protein [Bacillus stratosphericus]
MKKNKINEIRVQMQKKNNIVRMTPSLLKKQLIRPADSVNTIPQTKEKKYVYRTSDDELEFIANFISDRFVCLSNALLIGFSFGLMKMSPRF